MNITYSCPKCARPNRCEIDAGTRELVCPACGAALSTVSGAISEGGVKTCAACPSSELFLRKDFSQRLGVTIVAAGAILSSIAWAWRWPLVTYGILFAAALIDLVLYIVMGNVLECYHCKAQYRGLKELEEHEPFRLEIHERYRQQAARLAERKATPTSEGAKV